MELLLERQNQGLGKWTDLLLRIPSLKGTVRIRSIRYRDIIVEQQLLQEARAFNVMFGSLKI